MKKREQSINGANWEHCKSINVKNIKKRTSLSFCSKLQLIRGRPVAIIIIMIMIMIIFFTYRVVLLDP